jgi:hypothetical protein
MIRKAKWKGYTALALGGLVGFFARPAPTDFQPSTAAEAAGALFVQVPGLGLGLMIWGIARAFAKSEPAP